MSDSKLKETQPLAHTGNEQNTAPVTASAGPRSMRLNRLPRAGKQGGPQTVRDPDRTVNGPDWTNTVRRPPGSGEPVYPRRFPSGTIELTMQALHDLRCDACHRRGHECADCPWRARRTCIFCGSPDHARGVECDQPAVFNRYVYSGTVHAF